MNNTNYKSLLLSFVQEVKELNNPSFSKLESWSLRDDLENGISIGYSISNLSDRKLLHQIGQKYGLIPLCPHEVVDLEMGDDFKPKYAIVRTSFGNFKILPRKKSSLPS